MGSRGIAVTITIDALRVKIYMGRRQSRIRPVATVRMILGPVLRPILAILGVTGTAASVLLLCIGFFADGARDPDRIRYMMATVQLEMLNKALERYRADCGRYPRTEDGLDALVMDEKTGGWHGPYVPRVPLDPWQSLYVYRLSGYAPRVVSYGADRAPGGEFFNADLSTISAARPVLESPYELRTNRILLAVWLSAWPLLGASLYSFISASRADRPGDATKRSTLQSP